MMVLILGGSGSGKSSYAESVAVSLSQREGFSGKNMKMYYLATMEVSDKEGQRKVDRHRELRNGKGFLTIEQPAAIHRALKKMETGEKTVLLECISNLTANEMFSGERIKAEKKVIESVINGIEILKENITHLVVVSNNVFEDGIVYDETTMKYLHTMGTINQKLAAMAERVAEVVAGLPIIIKQ